MPVIFDGNRKNIKKFTQEFALYHMINQDSATMKNPYTCTTLALSFLRGSAINDWVLQQTESLFLKCNRDMLNGIAPTHCMNGEWLWVEFGHKFQRAFADTASEQWAYSELVNYTIGNGTIGEYIMHFEHLLQKAGWD